VVTPLPETIIIHVGTNDLRMTGNLDLVMREVHAFGSYSREETGIVHKRGHVYVTVCHSCARGLPKCRVVLGEVLRLREVSCRWIGAFNDRFDSFIFIPLVPQSTIAYEHGICQNTEFMVEQFVFAPCQIARSTGSASRLYIVIVINQGNTI
jgi:hypothetical protein